MPIIYVCCIIYFLTSANFHEGLNNTIVATDAIRYCILFYRISSFTLFILLDF
jgi:hypothetical protein